MSVGLTATGALSLSALVASLPHLEETLAQTKSGRLTASLPDAIHQRVMHNVAMRNQILAQRGIPMNDQTNGTISIIAALMVLLSAMVEPSVSIVLTVVALILLGSHRIAFALRGEID